MLESNLSAAAGDGATGQRHYNGAVHCVTPSCTVGKAINSFFCQPIQTKFMAPVFGCTLNLSLTLHYLGLKLFTFHSHFQALARSMDRRGHQWHR